MSKKYRTITLGTIRPKGHCDMPGLVKTDGTFTFKELLDGVEFVEKAAYNQAIYELDKAVIERTNAENERERLKKEVESLKEYKWKYEGLCK